MLKEWFKTIRYLLNMVLSCTIIKSSTLHISMQLPFAAWSFSHWRDGVWLKKAAGVACVTRVVDIIPVDIPASSAYVKIDSTSLPFALSHSPNLALLFRPSIPAMCKIIFHYSSLWFSMSLPASPICRLIVFYLLKFGSHVQFLCRMFSFMIECLNTVVFDCHVNWI